MAMEIKAIIFDWGGVLIADPAPGVISYCSSKLGVDTDAYQKAYAIFADDMQKGAISEDQFWEKMCDELNVALPTQPSLWLAAFEQAYKPQQEMLELAAELKRKGYLTAVLSNTETAVVTHFHKQKYDMFDELIFSCEHNATKPGARIYQIAIEALGVETGQAVFIDDKEEYIEGARQAGLNAIVFENTTQAKAQLASLGVRI